MHSAQTLLDLIHGSGILRLDVSQLPTKTARTDAIRLQRQHLRVIKQHLREAQADIKARWDGRNAWEGEQERRELAPYSLIDEMISSLELRLRQVETVPETLMPLYGDTLYGGHEYGFWQIGTKLEAQIWETETSIQKTLAQARSEKTLFQSEMKRLQNEIVWAKDSIDAMEKERKDWRKPAGGILFILLGVPAAIGGVYALVTFKGELGVFLAVCLFLVFPAGVHELHTWTMRRREIAVSIPERQAEIQLLREELARLKPRHQQIMAALRNRHYALSEQLKILKTS